MLIAYRHDNGRLTRLADDGPLADALWIDLAFPTKPEVEQLAALGVAIPSLAEMEEIELSNRLYREDGTDTMTVVMSGQGADNRRITGPVSFVLQSTRLVTVRHHSPRPFDTFPGRAEKVGPGCANPDQLFLGLVAEIIGRQADHLEAAGSALDAISVAIFSAEPGTRTPAQLQATLKQVGSEGEMLGKVRLALLTLDRAVSFFNHHLPSRAGGEALQPTVIAQSRDIQALEVHADFLSSRVALASDATLGMIDLAQNSTVRIVSVVAVLFSPPTLIASIYGMNFAHMPELASRWGYGAALIAMVASAGLTFLYFKWRKWL